jgi:hypothetical protein
MERKGRNAAALLWCCGILLGLIVVASPIVYMVRYGFGLSSWDTQAVTASFDGFTVDSTGNFLLFEYTLHNHTHAFFLDETAADLELTPHWSAPESNVGLDQPTVNTPITVPPLGAGRLTVKAAMPLAPRQLDGAPGVSDAVRSSLSHLDGFTLRDQQHHYVIELNRGW